MLGEPQIGAYTMPTVQTTGGTWPNPLLGITPASFAALCTGGTAITSAVDPVSTITWGCGAGPGGSDVGPRRIAG